MTIAPKERTVAEMPLCETCLERGRKRPATKLDLRMCDDCFSGESTCRAEELGDTMEETHRGNKIGLRTMSAEERRAYHREKQRKWRRKRRSNYGMEGG